MDDEAPNFIHLEQPRFHLPLSQTGLVLVGRIVLMWSQAEWFIDRIVERIYSITYQQMHVLVGERLSRIDIFARSVEFIQNDETRAEAQILADNMQSLKGDRNHIVHGFWGWKFPAPGGVEAAAISSKRKEPFPHSELVKFHDAVCAETHRAVKVHNLFPGSKFKESQTTFYFGPSIPPAEQSEADRPSGDRTAEANPRPPAIKPRPQAEGD